MSAHLLDHLIDPFTVYLEVNRNFSKGTVESYNGTIVRLATWLRETPKILELENVTAEHLQLFLGTLRHPKAIATKKGTKPHPKAGQLLNATTRARIISAIKQFFKWAVKQHYIRYDVSQFLDTPQLGERIPKSLTFEDAVKMEKAAGERKLAARDYLITIIFLLRGLRVSEMASLNVSELNQFNGTIGYFGKGNVERELLLTPKIVRALDEYMSLRKELLQRRNRLNEDALFISEKRGERLTRRGIELIIEEIAEKAGVKAGGGMKVSPHKLRHTCATILYNEGEGADLLAVAELLGHKDPNTTKIYTKIKSEKLRSIVATNPLEHT
ncbi:tyrosine-type recombinase/integrase [Paenibacillus gansuensis]|uniref:Tyrosine-type recombinase/integrase n=1 Tax=Paenibacillus gansuensis TaxID=306542 RepID=A0ABW5PJ91_9BACL